MNQNQPLPEQLQALGASFAEELADLQQAIEQASQPAHLARYLPQLQSPEPAACLLLYVTRPTSDSELSECIRVETPVELGLRMLGGLSQHHLIGIWPVGQVEAALQQAARAWLEVRQA